MSMDVCQRCDTYVDTDEDPDFYCEVGNMRSQTETIGLCERCRERWIDENERSAPDPDAQREAKRDDALCERQHVSRPTHEGD